MSQTPYPETDALLAMLRGNDTEAHGIVRNMTPKQRNDLRWALFRLTVVNDVTRVEMKDPGTRTAPPPAIDDPRLWTS